MSEFRGGTLNLPSEECTDCVWDRMCRVTEMDFENLDRRAAHDHPRGRADIGAFRGSYRRYRGEDPYPVLERIRSRLAPESHRANVLARAEAGCVGFAAQLRRRRTRRHRAGGWHTRADLQRVYDDQQGRCFYCGRQLEGRYEVDHKTPLSRGGSDWPENLCCACESCRGLKEERTAEEFAEYLAGLRRRRLK
jgi:5-methylcytosine-specific restriction endonuclease McrA